MFVPNNSIALVGYGNTLRGDDGAGIVTARLTAGLSKNLPVSLFEFQQLTIELADLLKDFKVIIFFDCSVNIRDGSFSITSIEPSDRIYSLSISHYLKPQDLIICIKKLYGTNPIAFLCQIGGKDFDIGIRLSDKVIRAVKDASKKVYEDIIKPELSLAKKS